jgi:hypothetical protein
MPISRAELIEKLYDRYGRFVKPTAKEEAYYEEMADSGTLLHEQERRDALRLAMVALQTGDPETASTALVRWNALFPENTYSSIEMLLGVENEI